MKKIRVNKDLYRIIIIYFISTIASGFIEHLTIEYDYIPNKDYAYSLIMFTLMFLLLIRLFNVRFKSVLIFLGAMMSLLVFVLLNLDFFCATTPDDIFPIISTIAVLMTLPFQYVIHTLQGYDIIESSYIIVPVYMIALTFLCYVIIKFNKNVVKFDDKKRFKNL